MSPVTTGVIAITVVVLVGFTIGGSLAMLWEDRTWFDGLKRFRGRKER